jgi:hypothetical protein
MAGLRRHRRSGGVRLFCVYVSVFARPERAIFAHPARLEAVPVLLDHEKTSVPGRIRVVRVAFAATPQRDEVRRASMHVWCGR